MAVRIRIADTKIDKERVYHFRYAIQMMALGNVENDVDHDNQWIRDKHDDTGCLLFAEQENKIIGTLRVHTNHQSDLPKEFSIAFQIEKLHHIFGPGQLAMTSRFLVDPRVRGKTVISLLMTAKFNYLLKHRIVINFMSCPAELTPLYERLGYQQYNQRTQQQKTSELAHAISNKSEPLLICLRDEKYLTQVMSPFAITLDSKLNDLGRTAQRLSETIKISGNKFKLPLTDLSSFWSEFADAHSRLVQTRVNIFSGLEKKEINFILELATHEIFHKGDSITSPSLYNAKVGILLRGKIGEGFKNAGGYHFVELYREGDCLTDPYYNHSKETHTALIAQEESEIAYLPKMVFETIKHHQPLLATRLTMSLISFLQQKNHWLDEAIDVELTQESYPAF